MSTHVFMDEKEIKIDVREYTSLGNLLDFLANDLLIYNRLLIKQRLVLDGQEIESEKINELKKSPPAKFASIKVYSKDLFEHIENDLSKVIIMLDQVQNLLLSVADLFRKGHTNEGNKLYAKCLNYFDHLTTILRTNTRIFNQLGLPFLAKEDISPGLQPQKMVNILRKIIIAQKNENWIELADNVQYELHPLLQDWQNFLPTLEKTIREHLQEKG